MQLHITKQNLDPNFFEPVRNNFHKPRGGLWTSTYNPRTNTSAWTEYCLRTEIECLNPYSKRWFLLKPKKNLNILKISSRKALIEIENTYKIEEDKPPCFVLGGTRLDYESLSQLWDGMHLTKRGAEMAQYPYYGNFLSWDCESILWFRWCFAHIEEITPTENPNVPSPN